MSDALFEMLDVDEKDGIDRIEVEELNKLLKLIRIEAAQIAREHDTDDTKSLLANLRLLIKEFRKNADPANARKTMDMHARGEQISFGDNPELARKAKLYDEVTDESKEDSLAGKLKKLQEAQTGTGPRGLGAGTDPVEAAMAKLRPLVEAKPDRVDGLVDLITKANSVSQAEYNERAALALLIMEGGADARLGNWKIVDDPNGTHRKPQVLVDALTKVASATKDKDAAEKALKDEKDATKADSLAQKLKNANDAKTAATTEKDKAVAELKDERDESKDGSLAKKLKDARAVTAPTNMVDKATVKAEVDKAKAKLNKVTGPVGTKPKGLDEAKRALNEVDNLVKPAQP